MGVADKYNLLLFILIFVLMSIYDHASAIPAICLGQ